MHCNICDRDISEPNYNRELEAFEPCDTCMEVIRDTIAGYTDKASADEDDFGDPFLPEDVLSDRYIPIEYE